MNFLRTLGAVATATLAFASQDAAALIIYSLNPTPGGEAYLSSRDLSSQNADTFVLTDDLVLNRISWWGTAGDGNLDAFEVLIYQSVDEAPTDAPLLAATGALSQTAAGLVTASGDDVFRFDLDGAFALLAGSYSLSVLNNGAAEWFWMASSDDDASFFRGYDGDVWEAVSGDLSMRLETADPVSVPEPGALALLGLGLVGFWAERGLRRRRTARSA